MGALTPDERRTILQRSPFRERYTDIVDRESAYERLSARAGQAVDASVVGKEIQGFLEKAARSAMSAASSELGRKIGKQLLRGILGSLGKR